MDEEYVDPEDEEFQDIEFDDFEENPNKTTVGDLAALAELKENMDKNNQIKSLQTEIDKINKQDTSGKKASIAIENLNTQIENLKKNNDENQITY